MKRIFSKILFLSAISISIVSCAGRKSYTRTADVSKQIVFRTEELPSDSLSVANVSWKTIFTDGKLQLYINQALSNNLDIRVALQNIEVARSGLLQSKYALLPSMNASVSYMRSTSSLTSTGVSPLPSRTYANTWDLTGTASWEIDVWGKLTAQKRANMASYMGTIAAHQAIQSEVVATVATSYYQLLMLDKQKQILTETIKLRDQSLQTTKELKQSGSTTEVAVQQTEALYYNAKSQLITIENSIKALENSICILLGDPPHDIERTSLDVQQFPQKLNEGYPMQILENRPDVRRAELSLIHNFELTNVARASFYPTLTLTGRGGVTSRTLEDWFSANSLFANLMAGLTQPIFNRRQIRTQYEISKANQEVALLNFKKTLISASKEVSDAIHHYALQDEYIHLKTKEMEAYQKATDYSKELFNSGLATYLEVITAEVNRLNSELSVATAQFNKMQYGITLYKALGGGWR